MMMKKKIDDLNKEIKVLKSNFEIKVKLKLESSKLKENKERLEKLNSKIMLNLIKTKSEHREKELELTELKNLLIN